MLRAVLDSAVDGIAFPDLDGNVQLSNRPPVRLVEGLGIVRGAPRSTGCSRSAIRWPTGGYVATMEPLHTAGGSTSVRAREGSCFRVELPLAM